MVEALPPNAAEEAFAHGVRAGVLGWASAAPRCDCLRQHGRPAPELAVVVADQESQPRTEWRHLTQLLDDPGIGRVARDADVGDAPRGQVDDEEGEDGAEAHVDDRQDVARPHVLGVVGLARREESPPPARFQNRT